MQIVCKLYYVRLSCPIGHTLEWQSQLSLNSWNWIIIINKHTLTVICFCAKTGYETIWIRQFPPKQITRSHVDIVEEKLAALNRAHGGTVKQAVHLYRWAKLWTCQQPVLPAWHPLKTVNPDTIGRDWKKYNWWLGDMIESRQDDNYDIILQWSQLLSPQSLKK